MALILVPWALGCSRSNSAQQARLGAAAPALASALIALNSLGDLFRAGRRCVQRRRLIARRRLRAAAAGSALAWIVAAIALSVWAERRTPARTWRIGAGPTRRRARAAAAGIASSCSSSSTACAAGLRRRARGRAARAGRTRTLADTRASSSSCCRSSQVLPGPNVVNLALMFGDRFFGLARRRSPRSPACSRAAADRRRAGRAYGEFGPSPVAGALRGMGAVGRRTGDATALKLMAPRSGAARSAAHAGRRVSRRADLRLAIVGCSVAAAGWVDRPALGPPRSMALVVRARERTLRSTRRLRTAAARLFAHFLCCRLLAVGGAITTAPDMHRYRRRRAPAGSATRSSAPRWRSRRRRRGRTCCSSPSSAGTSPGRWAARHAAGSLLPSTALTCSRRAGAQRRRETRGVRAFTPAWRRSRWACCRHRLGAGARLVGDDRARSARSLLVAFACGDAAHQAQPDVAGRHGCARRGDGLGLAPPRRRRSVIAPRATVRPRSIREESAGQAGIGSPSWRRRHN